MFQRILVKHSAHQYGHAVDVKYFESATPELNKKKACERLVEAGYSAAMSSYIVQPENKGETTTCNDADYDHVHFGLKR